MANELVQRLNLARRALSGKMNLDVQRREIPPITAEEVAEAHSIFPTEKFFIFGHARSGTTLLTRLIRLHPQGALQLPGAFLHPLSAAAGFGGRPGGEQLVVPAQQSLEPWPRPVTGRAAGGERFHYGT